MDKSDTRGGIAPGTREADFDGETAAQLLAERAAAFVMHRREGEKAGIIGLNGAQGSGKSTLASATAKRLEADNALSCLILSLDDFYLRKAERQDLSRRIHPLCATRGVPGTHDLPLMRDTLDALSGAGPDDRVPIPRFDKLADDRLPPAQWDEWYGRPDLVLLEGWCVGILDADLPAWSGPINALEAEHDADGAWFAWSREALAGYEPIWDRLGLLFSIAVPDLDTVIESRLRQERGLAGEEAAGAHGRPVMDREAVIRFVQHYERYTRALWAAMPARADLLLRRDRAFRYTLAATGVG